MTPRRRRWQGRVARKKAGYLSDRTRAEKVWRELDLIASGTVRQDDPIQEQLRQCPEAFQAGELIGKMFDAFRYSHDEIGDERYLPPAGTVMPPLV